MSKIFKKLKETSTWKGLIFLLTALGVSLSNEQQEAIIAGGVALVGIVDVFTNEKK